MGVWNSHTCLGNILGSLIAGAMLEKFGDDNWDLAFIIPGTIIIIMAGLTYLLLIPGESTRTDCPCAAFVLFTVLCVFTTFIAGRHLTDNYTTCIQLVCVVESSHYLWNQLTGLEGEFIFNWSEDRMFM